MLAKWRGEKGREATAGDGHAAFSPAPAHAAPKPEAQVLLLGRSTPLHTHVES